MTAPKIITVTLTSDEFAIATRPVVSHGGHQGLLRKILPRLNRSTRQLELLPQHIAKMREYAAEYGDGGYQGRFRAILAAVDRELGK